MQTLLESVSRLFSRVLAAQDRPADDPASVLMEHADRRAGLDARQARELRRAARAYLRVVR